MSRQPSGRLGQAIPTTIGELKIKLLGLVAIMKILIQYDVSYPPTHSYQYIQSK